MSGRPAVLFALLGLVALCVEPTLGVPPSGAAALALLAGLPHGALDHEIGPVLGMRSLPTRTLALVAYVALVAVGLLAFVVAPVLATLGFLALSGWHFGQGDLVGSGPTPAWLVASRGLVVVGLPVLGHPEASAPVLALLSGAAFAWPTWLEAAGPAVIGVLIAQHTVALAASGASRRRHMEHLALSLWLGAAHPLVGFALYFALWHALPHWRWMHLLLGPGAWRRAVVPTALALIGVAVLAAGGVWLRAALVGIAALTIPHALVVEALVRYAGTPADVGPAPSRMRWTSAAATASGGTDPPSTLRGSLHPG